MKLENIGFYTLSDVRAAQTSGLSPMWRGEIILTDRCNFSCPYCKLLRDDCRGAIDSQLLLDTLKYWSLEGLKNVRFSGGEPTLDPRLVHVVMSCESYDVDRIAISTNGSAARQIYEELIAYGVNDFSISLDACCASDGEIMSGTKDLWDTVISNICFLAEQVYVTVGVVVTPTNQETMLETIEMAHDLGVCDIRLITAVQNDSLKLAVDSIQSSILDAHPILRYRVNNLLAGRNIRGLTKTDCRQCYLVMDDSMVAGDYHFPCVIYLREGGEPIGLVARNMRMERMHWAFMHDSWADPICRNNCLDVCIDYNNKVRELQKVDA